MDTDTVAASLLRDEFEHTFEKGKAFLDGLEAGTPFHMLSTEQKAQSEHLQEKVVQFGTRFIEAMKLSPLLGDIDEEQARLQFRVMRGSLRLQLHSPNREKGFWHHYEVSLENSIKHYTGAAKEVRKLSLMIAPTSVELPSTIASRRSPEVQQYRPNTAFIMMQIDDKLGKLEDVKQGVKEVFKEFGIVALRADEIEHSDTITKRILDEIETCEFLFADLTGERPSVYYEVGYAHALGKRVMMFREDGSRLHFDLLVHNVKAYRSVTELKTQLRLRLKAITGHPAKG